MTTPQQEPSVEGLPPLPAPAAPTHHKGPLFTADQMHAYARDAQRLASQPKTQAAAVPELVGDAQAMAFHRALSDGPIGVSELEDIKIGLRAAQVAVQEVDAAQTAPYDGVTDHPEFGAQPAPTGLVDQALQALEPFVALSDKRDAEYARRGGDMSRFPDKHPAYTIHADMLPLGVWRKARAAITALRAHLAEAGKTVCICESLTTCQIRGCQRYLRNGLAGAATSASQPALWLSDEQIADYVCREVAKLPDRNSPEDWPEAMLVTHAELKAIVQCAIESAISPAAPAAAPLTPAARDVLAERQRQIDKEGWTHDHDDDHACCELAEAGACYAVGTPGLQYSSGNGVWPHGWEWKPKDERSNLVRAGALILAEVERLDRANLQGEKP